jgi:hypothetical protein
MALLPEIHYGRVYTHLDSLYEQLEHSLGNGQAALDELAPRFNRDAVYRAVKAREFRAPAPPWEAPAGARLDERIKRIRRALLQQIGPGLEPFLEAAEWFLASHKEPWGDNDYLCVPVMAHAGGAVQPGLVYLRTTSRMGFGQAPVGRKVEDLTADPALSRSGSDFFGRLADAMLRTFFLVYRLPFDADDHLSAYSYRLYFRCQITEGESVGAAAFVAFALGFLRQALGESYKSAVAPQRGLVLTGALDDTRVVAVEHVEEKVEAAIEEYGPSMRVILPESNRLPEPLERRLHEGNIIYVSTVEQLLAAALSDGEEPRKGLHEARRKVFAVLTPADLGELRALRRSDLDPDTHTRIAAGTTSSAPQSRDGGVYISARAWQNYIDIRLGMEPSAVQDGEDPQAGRELIQVILDGSPQAFEYWAPDSRTGISRLTGVLFEIAARIDSRREDLEVAFLGAGRFHGVKAGALAPDLERLLQKARSQDLPERRGSFFRPVYEESVRRFAARQKRVFLIADAHVPDLHDRKDMRVSCFVHMRLTPDPDAEPWPAVQNPVLFPDGSTLDPGALAHYFARERGTLAHVEVIFGEELPLEWLPIAGELTREAKGFTLGWRLDGALRARFRVRMAHAVPPVLGYSYELNRDGTHVKFGCEEPCLADGVEKLDTSKNGRLSESELSLWQTICRSGEACPECGNADVHLLHPGDMTFHDVPVFPSLRKLENGYLALRESAPGWQFFPTGAEIGRTAVVGSRGMLHASSARGHYSEISRAGDVYVLETREGLYYMTRV